jgi:hypothetical protein
LHSKLAQWRISCVVLHPTKRMKWLRPCIGFDREEMGKYWDILPKLG